MVAKLADATHVFCDNASLVPDSLGTAECARFYECSKLLYCTYDYLGIIAIRTQTHFGLNTSQVRLPFTRGQRLRNLTT